MGRTACKRFRQYVETIKNNQAKFKEDLKSFEQKLESTTEYRVA